MKLNELTVEHATALGIPQSYIGAAAGSGIALSTLLSWVMTYGLPILTWLAKTLGWNLPPLPLPPAPPLPPPTATPS
jgi:hypothetical protein